MFLCNINDLAYAVHDLGVGIFLYANDAVIYCKGINEDDVRTALEQSINCIDTWCSLNYININVDKTKFCIYGTRSKVKTVEYDRISYNTQSIHRCHQYNYLGVLLDECLNLSANFNKIIATMVHC